MANEYKLQDLIDQYLLGTLEGEALDIFKKRLRDDADFAKQVELQKMLVDEIQEVRKAELKEYLAENAEVQYIQNIWGTKWMYASAAIVTVAIGLYFVLQRLEPVHDMASEDKQNTETVHDGDVAEAEDAHEIQEAHDSVERTMANVEEQDSTAIAEVQWENDANNSDSGLVRLRDLSKEEQELASDDKEVVEKDSLNSTKSYVIVPVQEINKVIVTPEAIEDSVEEETPRKKLRVRKNNSENTEAASGNSVDSISREVQVDEKVANELAKPVIEQSITVEFWNSVVKFEGYKLNGKKLQLYGVNETQNIIIKKYLNSLYINIDGTYFVLLDNNKFNKYQKVTDTKVLELLTK